MINEHFAHVQNKIMIQLKLLKINQNTIISFNDLLAQVDNSV